MTHRITMLILSGAIALATGVVRAETIYVGLLLSDTSPPYLQFADALKKSLSTAKTDAAIVESQAAGSGIRADLIVAVGMKATEMAAAQNGTPMLVAMVPEAGYKKLIAQASHQKPGRQISAIYLNQPWARQIDFLQAVLPRRHRIGLLFSPDAGIDVESLRKQVTGRGGSLVAVSVQPGGKFFPGLESVLESSDMLLTVPDSAIYNNSNIRNILLTSYRKGVPIVGLSQPYVNAGALCAVFSTIEQMAEQTATAVDSFSRSRHLPEPQYPSGFTVAVNLQVARSLGIDIPSPEEIRNRMGKGGRWKK